MINKREDVVLKTLCRAWQAIKFVRMQECHFQSMDEVLDHRFLFG